MKVVRNQTTIKIMTPVQFPRKIFIPYITFLLHNSVIHSIIILLIMFTFSSLIMNLTNQLISPFHANQNSTNTSVPTTNGR